MATTKTRLLPLLLICTALAAMPRPAAALVVAGGANNTSAPADDPGWAWTGNFSNKNSGVYLGYGWVLTAYHCVAYGGWSSFILADGSSHTMDTAAGIRRLVTTNTAGQVVNADLALVKMSAATPPAPGGVAPVHRIADSGLIAGDAVTMIGNGGGAGSATLTYWDVSTAQTPWTWTETANKRNAELSSYAYDSANRDLRWGNNTVYAGTPTDVTGLGVNKSLATVFEYTGAIQSGNRTGVANEAQAVAGDSGGAVFHKEGNTWELAGIMFSTAGYSGQPANHAVEGMATYFADLSHYQSQILQIVPEPSTVILGLLAIGAGLTLRRRLDSTK